jgi:hypothetical protein
MIDSPTIRIAVYALALGIAWASLEAKVSQKADRAVVETMAAEVRDIKTILCSKAENAHDSACQRK